MNSFNNYSNICPTQINFHTHENNTQKISIPMKIMPTHQILIISYPHKNKIKIHPTRPQATCNTKFHKPSTLSKLHNLKQLNNSKMSLKKSIRSYNDSPPNHTMSQNPHKSKQQQNDNASS